MKKLQPYIVITKNIYRIKRIKVLYSNIIPTYSTACVFVSHRVEKHGNLLTQYTKNIYKIQSVHICSEY